MARVRPRCPVATKALSVGSCNPMRIRLRRSLRRALYFLGHPGTGQSPDAAWRAADFASHRKSPLKKSDVPQTAPFRHLSALEMTANWPPEGSKAPLGAAVNAQCGLPTLPVRLIQRARKPDGCPDRRSLALDSRERLAPWPNGHEHWIEGNATAPVPWAIRIRPLCQAEEPIRLCAMIRSRLLQAALPLATLSRPERPSKRAQRLHRPVAQMVRALP